MSKSPKHVQRRERGKQEREAERRLRHAERESASWNKKSTKSKSNGSEKSENGSWNTNASVASEPEKNVSKSVCGACSGMQRSSVSRAHLPL